MQQVKKNRMRSKKKKRRSNVPMPFKPFFRQRGIRALALLCVGIYTAIILVIAFFNLYAFSKEVEQSINQVYPVIDYQRKPLASPSYFNILNGEPSQNEEDAVVFSRAVVIDNDINARPQSGLERASIIIEFPVEGGITRFAAIFNPSVSVPKIGPVRSVRQYFVDFTEDIGAMIAHSGGSPDALRAVKLLYGAVADLDEIGPLGRYFWRDPALYAPHDLFTSSTLLTKAFEDGSIVAPKKPNYTAVGWKWRESPAIENNALLNNQDSSRAENSAKIVNNNGAQKGKSILIDYSPAVMK
jgi:hypothetical protein